MSLDVTTLEHLARLTHLDLSADERARFSAELELIMEHLRQLAEVELTGIDPWSSGAATTAWAPDEEQPCLGPERAQASAARQGPGGFLVPSFVDEG